MNKLKIKGASQWVNKAKKILLLGNRQQATGNSEYIGKKYFGKYEMHPRLRQGIGLIFGILGRTC